MCYHQNLAFTWLNPLYEYSNTSFAFSSDQEAAKLSECKFVHGSVLFMMERNLDDPDSLQLWKNLCINLIKLATDKDDDVRQFCEPLLMQMMHFFSQPSKILSPMTNVMTECLLISICHYESSKVQDLSARLLCEFFSCTNEETNCNQRQATSLKLVELFFKMKEMSIETDSSRRICATSAFNNTFQIICKDEALINVYWIFLLDVFSTNFK